MLVLLLVRIDHLDRLMNVRIERLTLGLDRTYSQFDQGIVQLFIDELNT